MAPGARHLYLVWFVTTAVLASTAAARPQSGSTPNCQPAGSLARLPGLPEASGVAVGSRAAGQLWAIDDSGRLSALTLPPGGATSRRVVVAGAAVHDWEAIAVGPCPEGSCLYIGDIGDNNAIRPGITIYRVPEPTGNVDRIAATGAIHATYPDSPKDAEALLVTPDGRLFVVTKGDVGPAALYRIPPAARSGEVVRLERVGAPRPQRGAGAITDGTVSADGRWVVLRTKQRLTFYPAGPFLAGQQDQWTEARVLDLRSLGEPQGEGLALGADKTMYLVGEGGGTRFGTIARMACSW